MDAVAMPRRFFFVRVMRTGTTTLTRILKQELGEDAVYPAPRHSAGVEAAISVELLLERWRVERQAIRAIAGHFPFATIELLDARFSTLTILRDPVERTLSQLRRFQNTVPAYRNAPLEQIYEDPWRFHHNIHNQMVKLFSLTRAEALEFGLWSRVDFGPDRLERAKTNLESVDVVGLQERFDDLCQALAQRFGWTLRRVPRDSRTAAAPVSAAFRRRIARDNELDLELYEYGRDLVSRHTG